MSKHVKAIASAMIVVTMLVTFNMHVMAAERISDNIVSDESVEMVQDVASEDNNQTRASYFQSFSYSGTISAGKKLGTVYLSQSAKTVQWNIGRTGSSGLVRFRLANQANGEVRQVTAVADNVLGSLTWVDSIPAGTYDVSIEFVSSSSTVQGLNLYFYH